MKVKELLATSIYRHHEIMTMVVVQKFHPSHWNRGIPSTTPSKDQVFRAAIPSECHVCMTEHKWEARRKPMPLLFVNVVMPALLSDVVYLLLSSQKEAELFVLVCFPSRELRVVRLNISRRQSVPQHASASPHPAGWFAFFGRTRPNLAC